ncbi:hypothetical protein LSH36_502g00028 [Paralvinella palmiformis]|uniref:Major facilitator superfamily (MFS) profile domain-containing protein n=1 Tax=Paralvinella palmiformis TaxID=53620 RepID=A0AAD9J8B4_9ANNE|nr:hypothetical protein LSH36_502g00028 [Paralvinella palmiformis]
METKTNDDASKDYSSTNQNPVRDGNSFDDNKDVSLFQLDNSCRNQDLNVFRSLCRRFARWRAEAEPWQSWLVLVLGVIPVSILVGFEIIIFSIYYVEYVEYFQVPRSTPGFIITIKTGVTSIFGILTSTFIKRYPARIVCTSGGLLSFLAHVASSFAPNIYVLYITEGVMLGVSLSLITLTTGVLIQQHFYKNRTLGNGLHMLGLSLGYLIAPPIVTKLIKVYGWRGSFLIYGAIIANTIVFAFFCKQPPPSSTRNRSPSARNKRVNEHCLSEFKNEEKNNEKTENTKQIIRTVRSNKVESVKSFCLDVFDFSIIKQSSFLVICIAAMLARYTSVTFIHHLPNKAATIGLSKEEAAMLMSIFGISGICFRVLVTVVANHAKVNRMAFYGCGLFVGFVGMTNTIRSVIIVEQIGISRLPKAMAILNLFIAVSAMSAMPVGGMLKRDI